MAWLRLSLLSQQLYARPWLRVCGVALLALAVLQTLAWAKRNQRPSPQRAAQAWSPNVAERIVQPGETLWQLCDEVTGQPWTWPRLWALNPQLTNPHWIRPGERIVFVPSAQTMQTTYSAIPANQRSDGIQAIPRRISSESEIPIALNRGIQAMHTILLTSKELESSGRIERALAEHTLLRQGNTIIIDFARQLPEIGAELLLFKQGGSVHHPSHGRHVGYTSYVTGIAKVDQIVKKSVKATISKSFLEVELGQRATVLQTPWREDIVPLPPSQQMVQGYVVATEEDRALVGQGHCVFIDKGSQDGLAVGHSLLVKSHHGKQDHDFSSVIASLLIIDVRETTATCLIRQMSQEIRVGDTFVTPPAIDP